MNEETDIELDSLTVSMTISPTYQCTMNVVTACKG